MKQTISINYGEFIEQAKIALKMQLLLEVIFNEMKESNK